VNYLAIDASTEACSVALQFDGQTFSRYELCPQSHSLLLLPMVDSVLKEAGCKLAQLDGLIFGRGPGSFTGVRIGVGVAQGLAFAANLKVVGVSTLQAMAQRAYAKYSSENVIAAIDARMSEVYSGFYQLDDKGVMQPSVNESVLKPQELATFLQEMNTQCAIKVGSGWAAYKDELANVKTPSNDVVVEFPHAEDMLVIGHYAFAEGEAVDAEQAQPVYVRDTVSWKKLPGRE